MKTFFTKNLIPLITAILIISSGCKEPKDCKLVAREPKGNWELITAYPSNIISPPSGGNVGTANVICIYKRSCVYWFECCDKFFPVTGFEFGTLDPGPGSVMPVITLGMPLPLQGALGQVASSLGVSIEIATWFTDQDAANAICGAATGVNHKADFYEAAPKCDGKNIILPWHKWPVSVALDKLPDEVISVN